MFGNVRRSLRNNFGISSEIFGKWSEIFGKSSKTSLLVCLYNKQNITCPLVDMNFISTRRHVISSIYYTTVFLPFRLHEILQTAYLLGALEVMAGSVTISQKMNIYLDLLPSLKAKVSANHFFFECCFIHCELIYWSCRIIQSSLVLGCFRSLLDICLKNVRLKLEVQI